MLAFLSFTTGLLVGFLIGVILTFKHFRTRWSAIRQDIIQGKDVTSTLLDTISREKGGFVGANKVEDYLKANPGASLQDVIEE
jgi:uncharacterized protein YneF (UPF0154 family)